VSDDPAERELRMEWLRMQLRKSEFDMDAMRRTLNRQTAAIIVSVIGVVIAAFAAGAASWHFFHG
jgi:hypothetical protein